MTEGNRIIRECMKTLREVSTNDQGYIMVDSDIVVINYDDVAIEHAKLKRYPPALASNDALFFDNSGSITFVEFKNGQFKARELHEKSRESVLMALDLNLAKSLKEIQSTATYILVYNPANVFRKRTDSQELTTIFGRIQTNALATVLKDKLSPQRWLFKDTYAFTSNEFLEYIDNICIATELPSVCIQKTYGEA